MLLRVKGSTNEITKIITKISNVESVTKKGVNEPNTVDILIKSKKDTDIRESLFNALSNAKLPILMMQPLDLTLEQIFLEVTDHKKEESKNANNF
ncbi:hypothetical protein ACFIJ5_07020 [Haloimpatiens sp. FM7330]|uniref:hypothetical protein n=1 Tax=Haloimpatiens sp. FM7330 TaxID=3298610 RepID=UPI003640858C